ncbi:MAG: tRNA glutamyl-Q(34) synthetase GluQRS [Bacteroidales bacterium]|nr:tRNA glutamyl-Q(34) synthetase GluQRS [Bacteroidales bacterium]
MRVTGRLAPSPTGAQHVGNARTYLIAWLAARSRGGRVVLRIEDIDTWRNKPGAAEQALEDLRWLGLDWDDEPWVQLQRLPVYRSALEELKARNRVYPCTCTRSDILAAASAPHAADLGGPVYPGTCAHRTPADANRLDRPFAWRFRASEPPAFTDLYCGEIHVAPALAGGDFVVWRNDDMPAYQLAVVVDDAAQGITEVVRGDDLIPSTPRQLMLYQALGLTPPRFAHVPMVVGPDGKRLAKRHGDTRLSQLRDSGVSPQSLVGLLAWSCGWQTDDRPVSPSALLSLFQWASIPSQPFVLTEERVAGLLP